MFYVGIDTGETAHPGFSYPSFEEAKEAVFQSVMRGTFQHGNVLIVTGPGTIIQIVSQDFLDKKVETKLNINENVGLLIVQVRGSQLPPFLYESAKEAQHAASVASLGGSEITSGNTKSSFTGIFHENVPQHQYTCIHLGRGAVLIAMSGKDFIDKQKEALAKHMQAQAEASAPRIIVPGRS